MRVEDAEVRVGTRVVLKTFLGTSRGSAVRPADDFWRLIDCTGTIVDDDDAHVGGRHPRGRRVLVRFDTDVRALGLHCHNPVPDALWIFTADLAGWAP
jgi:hypothetical protein